MLPEDSEKDRGLASQLYAHGVIDAMRWQHHEGEPLNLWTPATTAPTMMRNHLIDVAPRPDGAYPTASARIAMAIRRELGPAYSCSSHPFVVKGLAKSTRYSQREIARLRQAKDRIDFRLFDQLGIDENYGDRLLITAALPSARHPTTVRAQEMSADGGWETQ